MIKQYAKVFTNLAELNDFIKRGADAPWFEVMDLSVAMARGDGYLAERYVLLYKAQEPLV